MGDKSNKNQFIRKMKTIHILEYQTTDKNNTIGINDEGMKKQKELIKELFSRFLKDDSIFHFLYEPELIIRIESLKCLNEIKEYLDDNNISYIEYDYPFPPNPQNRQFGEDPKGIIAKNFSLFLPIFHSNAIVALEMNGEDHFNYLERVIHTACNSKAYNHIAEGLILKSLAEIKLNKKLVINSQTSNTG
jgi:hypothetical protein